MRKPMMVGRSKGGLTWLVHTAENSGIAAAVTRHDTDFSLVSSGFVDVPAALEWIRGTMKRSEFCEVDADGGARVVDGAAC